VDALEPNFREFREGLVGLAVSHVWRGYGTALFIEFGELRPSKRTRRNGTPGNPEGQFGLMIDADWRIERISSIICGSTSDDAARQPTLEALAGGEVKGASLFGRLPEISIELTDGIFVVSFTTSEGDPEWALADRRNPDLQRWLSVRDGNLRIEVSPIAPEAPMSE
jgi:hypothetical protein